MINNLNVIRVFFVFFFVDGYVFLGRAYVKLSRSSLPVAFARVFDTDSSKLASFCWDRDLDLWTLYVVFFSNSFWPLALKLLPFSNIIWIWSIFQMNCTGFDRLLWYRCQLWDFSILIKSALVNCCCPFLFLAIGIHFDKKCAENIYSLVSWRLGIDHWYFNLVTLSLIYKHSLTTVNVHWSPQNDKPKWHDLSIRMEHKTNGFAQCSQSS